MLASIPVDPGEASNLVASRSPDLPAFWLALRKTRTRVRQHPDWLQRTFIVIPSGSSRILQHTPGNYYTFIFMERPGSRYSHPGLQRPGLPTQGSPAHQLILPLANFVARLLFILVVINVAPLVLLPFQVVQMVDCYEYALSLSIHRGKFNLPPFTDLPLVGLHSSNFRVATIFVGSWSEEEKSEWLAGRVAETNRGGADLREEAVGFH